MSQTHAQAPLLTGFPVVARASASARAEFIQLTYLHLALAVGAFVLLEMALFRIPAMTALAGTMVTGYNWLLVLGAFMAVSWLADRWAHSNTSPGVQYLGLGLYVLAQAVIFFPLLWFASVAGGSGVIGTAAVISLVAFGGLSAMTFITRQDFSFLRGGLVIAGLLALGLIACSIVFGFDLGILFTVVMIALAAGYVLYHTSNVIHHYRVGQHVAAALALFSALGLLFWYVLQLLMRLRN